MSRKKTVRRLRSQVVADGEPDRMRLPFLLHPRIYDTDRRARARRETGARLPRMSSLDRETEERIEQPVSEEAEREARLTPAEAVERMRINVPRARQPQAPHADRARQPTTSS